MNAKRVMVFSQPGCPPCNWAKAHLSEKGVQFEEKDITANREFVSELVGKYQSRSTPTIVVDDEVMIGFDPERLDKMLGI